MDGQLQFEFALLIILIIIARVAFLVHKITTGYSKQAPKRSTPCKTTICIGSGGHTTEMLHLISSIDFQKYWPRYYVLANSDTTSLGKITNFEGSRNSSVNNDYFVILIPRSRSVGQSYVTSVITTIVSILYSIPIVFKLRTDLLICNGPGTCIPICLLSFLARCMFICETRIVFIESYCRTQTFSLTGKILIFIADNFLVQWPSLRAKLKRAEYIGQLM